jgi:competence protein ComEC
MDVPQNPRFGKFGARILSVLVVVAMVASAMVIVPDANEGGLPPEPQPGALANYVVISEVLNECIGLENNEFIELYNPTGSPISLVGWDILYSASTFSSWTVKYTIGSGDANGGVIPAHGYYLIGEEDGAVLENMWAIFGIHVDNLVNPALNLGMGQNSHVGIRDASDVLIDRVGQGTATNPETTAVAQPTAGNSVERKSGATHVETDGNGWDTDNNMNDFTIRAAQPQNRGSAIEVPPGDTTPPSLSYALSTGTTAIEAHFNEPVNQADAETLSKWKIVSLSGFDTVAPYITECKATSTTSVEVTFSEAVNSADANDIYNYDEVGGLGITNALLNSELTTVTLTTNTQVVDKTYILQVSFINDTASPPNVIEYLSETTFNGGGGGGTMRVAFIDVEQGDATLVVSPTGKAMLFDGGDSGTGPHILSTLTSYGVSQLMYTVVSHYHEDHIGAMDDVISGLGGISQVTGACFDRGGTYSSSIYDEYADAVFSKRMTITKGMVLDLGGGVTATCVAVNGNGVNPPNENDLGVVLRVDYQNFQMYLGGDLGGFNDADYRDIESTVANDVGKVEVYQADHHGSMYSSNSYFLSVTDPLVSVFSVGSNGYGHVSQEAFNRVLAQGSYMYYTNAGAGTTPSAGQGEIVGGDVDLTTDGSSFVIEGDAYPCHDLVDSIAPTVIDVRATDLTHVEVTFSESVNQADAETEANYVLASGIGTNPSLAVLKADLRTVNLTTALQTDGQTYTITISNIRDRAVPANTILAGTIVTFTGGRPTLQITGASIDALDHSLVHLTTSVQARTGYQLYAFNIRDEATSPNNQPETTVNFVGGGYHITISEIFYDATNTDDNFEWWEIHNPEANGVNIKSWKFLDDGNSFGLPPEDIVVAPGQYASMAMNGDQFRRTYGYYPDFEVFGSTPSKDMSYSGSYLSTLGNTADYLEMANSRGQLYDVVAWGTVTYGSMTNFTAPDVAAGSSLKRVTPGREGPEGVLASSPTGADEQSERQNSGVFQAAVPSPQTLDSQAPSISNVQWDIGSVHAVIYWDTSETGWPEINPEGDSRVVYSANANPDSVANASAYSADRVTEHGIMVYPLVPSTDYYFYVSSTDGKGQTRLDKNGGSYYHITTAAADSTAPAISNVQATVSDTTALITWDTDEISSSLVRYGTAAPPLGLQTNLHLTSSHAMMLSGLAPSTLHYYSVSSKNPTGLVTLDDNSGAYYSFTTTAPDTINFYMGDMDSFTEYSSGISTPAEAYDYANGAEGALEPGATHIVISEVVNECAGTEDHEFVELYNPTGTAISLVGWDIVYSSTAFSSWTLKYTITASDGNNGIIPANGFYLIGEEGGGANDVFHIFGVHVDNLGNPGINLGWGANCHVGIRNAADTLIDRIGFGTATNPETTATPQPGEGESAERKSGTTHVESNGNGYDTDNNMNDFFTKVGPEPQNSGSAVEIPTAGSGPDIHVLGINDNSYQLTGAEYTRGKAEEANKTVSGDFVALYGQQLWGGSEGYGQISVYGENTAEVATGDALLDIAAAYDWVIDHQAVGIFNTPGYRGTFNEMAYNAAADEYMCALEMLGGTAYFSYEYYYNLGLRNGWHYGAIAGQRNDLGNWGNKINSYNKIDMTMFRAPDLTRASIENSLATMNFYAYEADTTYPPTSDPVVLDPIFLNFSVNGYEMGQEFTESNELVFYIELDAANPFHTVEVIEDGQVIMTWSQTPTAHLDWQFGYQPAKGHHYYYVRGNQSDTYRSKFWSSPIWVYNPALALPDLAPVISNVKHTPNSPMSTNNVIVTAKVTDAVGVISAVNLWRSVNGAAYTSSLMKDDGIAPDTAAGDGIYSVQLAAMPDGTNVHYYIRALDDAGLEDLDPSDAPTHYYSFYVGPRILINEVYADAYDTVPLAGEESEFIEIFNPTGAAINLQDFTIKNEYYYDMWAFPSYSLAAGAYAVIARDSYYQDGVGGYRSDAQLIEPGEQNPPRFEMYDSQDYFDDVTAGQYNMILVEGNTEIKLNNGYDGIELFNAQGTILDAMEWGSDYSWVPGKPAAIAPENCALTRDYDHTDTDNSYADFSVIGNPTPGATITTPTINNVTHAPACPLSTQTVDVTARIRDDATVPTGRVYYNVNGGAYTYVAMTNLGSNLFRGTIPAQAAGSVVRYYIYGATGPTIAYSPYGAPTSGTYIYTVWEHLVISEVYYNPNIYVDEVHNSKFLEIYNPMASAVDISGWQLWGEPSTWARKWTFPASTSIASGEALTIAITAGDAGTTGFFTDFGALPDFELYDPTMTSETYTDHDNAAVPNLLLVTDDNYDDQIGLEGPSYFDALYLVNPAGSVVDSMEYGIEGEDVPGNAAVETDVGFSLSRDELATDTDDSYVDFTPGTPTPGVLFVTLSTFDIPLPGGIGWNFVSFPLLASGSVIDVLDDMGGGTLWDVVKWYNPNTPSDPWKTYRVGGTANDLPDIGNTMGLWVHITALGSDSLLTVEGAAPVSTAINLRTGWNLVSYPSATPEAANSTLSATTADKMAVYLAASPYISDTSDLTSVTMQAGRAYWIHVTSDCLWTVTY